MAIEFGVLGPLRVLRDGAPVPLGGPRQRAVLARLLLEPGRFVPVPVLIEDVWSGSPPATADKILQKYVSELRKSLGADVVQTSGRGYALAVDRDAVDAALFEHLVDAGDCSAALALWRGEALADLPETFFVLTERSRLAELRLSTVERVLDDEVSSGRHAEAVPRLFELAAKHPERERICAMLMLALYRSGRQVEALEAFRRHRRHLADEVGIDPADDLVALESAILRHDPALLTPPGTAGASRQPSGNLRLPASSFVGRDAERQAVGAALHHSRLVTLIGPGGVGKTRLATHVGAAVADRYAGGVWLVDLSGLTDPDHVAHLVMITLGVADETGQDDEETVCAAVRHRDPLLLVMDNCEHLVDAVASLVDHVVHSCPDARVLATSRRPLGVDGERVVPVLPLPDREACRLFADRARLSGASRDDTVAAQVAGICASLDGLPLAVELTAAQLRVLGPDATMARLDDRLRFASRRFGAPPRQRTLRETVAWSHDLLPEATQQVFARLGVFATTFTLEAAAAATGEDDVAEHIATLVDHSLLTREPTRHGASRFRLLETLRLFALEKLDESGDGDLARRAHAEHYLRLLESAGPNLFGPEEREWAGRVGVEEANVHSALTWAAERDRELALRLGVAMWPYWDLRWREGYAVGFLSAVVDAAGPSVPATLRAWALTAMADLAANPGEARLATGWADEAVRLFRRAGDDHGVAAALLAMGSALGNEGALDAADAALDEALSVARRLGAAQVIARALNFTSFIATRRGDHRLAETLTREELAEWSRMRSMRGEATALRHIAVALQHQGDLAQAMQLCERALVMWQQVEDTASIAHVGLTMGDIVRLRGEPDEARRRYETALQDFRRIGDRRCTASTYKNLAALAQAGGDHTRSAGLYVDAIRLRYALGDFAGLAECFDGLAGALAATGRHDDAEALLGAAEERRRASGAVSFREEMEAADLVASTVRAALSEQRRLRARDRGRRWSVDEAVSFALALDPAGADPLGRQRPGMPAPAGEA